MFSKKTKKQLSFWGIWVLAVLLFASNFGFASSSTSDIREVKLRFCDAADEQEWDIRNLLIETEPGLKETICMDIINGGNKSVSLGINFVDGALTADSDQKKACLPEGEKTYFGQYVTDYEEEVNIPARSTQRVLANLEYPGGYAGDSYGCVTLHVIDQDQKTLEQSWQVFQVFSRLGYFVDAFVDGDFVVDLIALPQTLERFLDRAKNNLFPFYKNKWIYHLRAELFNRWNITVAGDIGIGYHYWWIFGKKEIITEQSIIPKQSKTLEKKIPRYLTYLVGGPFKSKIQMQYSPVYYGKNADKFPTNSFVFEETNYKFFIPWGLLVLFLVYFSFKYFRKQKKDKKFRLFR